MCIARIGSQIGAPEAERNVLFSDKLWLDDSRTTSAKEKGKQGRKIGLRSNSSPDPSVARPALFGQFYIVKICICVQVGLPVSTKRIPRSRAAPT